MNITFLIGNGFDLNLGLHTTYADFINYYKNIKTDSDEKDSARKQILDKFHKYIDDNEKLWKNAEIALGQYTKEFNQGEGMNFSVCQQDLCENLVDYLKSEESRFLYENFHENILSAFKNILIPEKPFPTQEKAAIRGIFDRCKNESYNFNFICFNYTSTLDKCLEVVRNSSNGLGKHQCGSTSYSNSIGELCHVHGTVEKEIVFAVNDETQIAKPDIFDFENGEICKHFLIKQQANESYQENTDSKANQILNNSTIIYIYGMSLGETDALWWSRICKWLIGSDYRHIIIQNHSMPAKGVFSLPYQLAEVNKKMELLSFSNFKSDTKKSLLGRIHITGDNIFEKIKDVSSEKDATISQIIEHIEEITMEKKKVV